MRGEASLTPAGYSNPAFFNLKDTWWKTIKSRLLLIYEQAIKREQIKWGIHTRTQRGTRDYYQSLKIAVVVFDDVLA